MKKTHWLIFAAFAAAAALLRVLQNHTGFEETGLAVRGNLPGLLLPVVLVLAAAYFTSAAWKLPAKRDESAELADRFALEDTMPLAGIVAGAFLVAAGAAAAFVSSGSSLAMLLLAVFGIASALSVLYVAFTLRRGGDVQGVALLVPVCALVVYLIFLYRADASDPVLARIYVEILTVALLTFSAIERAAFAFRNGSPRLCRCAGVMAALLALTAAADGKSLAALLFFAGCALVELGFLAASKFETQ